MEIKPIAHIYTDFKEKFGIPRQSGLVKGLVGRIVFTPEFRYPEALREMESFSHLWLIWLFSEAVDGGWRPTVRPPRLGGNKRVGVFASRAPYRPNNLGLSCVKLDSIDYDCPDGPVIIVSGIDILDGTPIFDIKPYIPVADCHPEASEGYTAYTKEYNIEVNFPKELLQKISEDKQDALIELLSGDPRPGYDNSPDKKYGLSFDSFDIGFTVENGILRVFRVEKRE